MGFFLSVRAECHDSRAAAITISTLEARTASIETASANFNKPPKVGRDAIGVTVCRWNSGLGIVHGC